MKVIMASRHVKTSILYIKENYNMYFCAINSQKIRNMAVMKVIEILSNSPKSWEDATSKGIRKASKSINNIKSAFVQSQSVVVKAGKVTEFRVNLKVTFEVG